MWQPVTCVHPTKQYLHVRPRLKFPDLKYQCPPSCMPPGASTDGIICFIGHIQVVHTMRTNSLPTLSKLSRSQHQKYISVLPLCPPWNTGDHLCSITSSRFRITADLPVCQYVVPLFDGNNWPVLLQSLAVY